MRTGQPLAILVIEARRLEQRAERGIEGAVGLFRDGERKVRRGEEHRTGRHGFTHA
jgi:hypothetical protein